MDVGATNFINTNANVCTQMFFCVTFFPSLRVSQLNNLDYPVTKQTNIEFIKYQISNHIFCGTVSLRICC